MHKGREMKIKKWIVLIILVISIIGVYWRLICMTNTTTQVVPYKSNVSGEKTYQLTDTLTKRTMLGMSNLSVNKQKRFNKLNGQLAKKKFYGAIIGIENNEMKYSVSYGYANQNSKSVFQIGTTFLVGRYQEVLEDALLLKLKTNKKILLNKKVSSYLSKVEGLNNLTIKELLKNDKLFYLKKNVVNIDDLSGKKIRVVSFQKRGYVDASMVLKSMLISKITGVSYHKSMNDFLSDDLKLFDTRFVNRNSEGQLNDAIGYRYSEDEGVPVQNKELKNNDKSIRMSLSDFLLSLDKIVINAKVGHDKKLLFSSIENLSSNFKTSGDSIRIHFNEAGQNLDVLVDKKHSKVILVATNFPNKSIKTLDLISILHKEY